MPFKSKKQTALTVLSVLMVILILLYTARAYSIQIINAHKYSSAAGSVSVRKAVLKAPRGEILDRFGRKIAVNRDGYNVVFNKAYVKDNLNDVILTLINLLEKNEKEWTDKLPLDLEAPYGFSDGKSTSRMLKTLKLAHYATSENCFDKMVEKYELEGFDKAEQRKIMGVRYTMEIEDFSISYPFTLAEDIPTELMRQISESSFMLDGVTVDVVPFRDYSDTSLAVNLIGTVGPIFEEDWKNYKDKGYSFNDKVGKSGIELWAEEYLHGEDGEITYYLDSSGAIVDTEVTKTPIAGKTVRLTLDKAIQRTAQNSLMNTVIQLQSSGGTAKAGSAVVMDVKSGNVIAAANYPTYDLATMNEVYDDLLKDPAAPLTNRAFQGVYPLGSTIKPIVAVAALENGHYDVSEHIFCSKEYKYFADYTPSCMGRHGSIGLNTALSRSCNYFFFELGRRVGALTLTDYYKQFGLGKKTGVEVDDSSGILYEPEGNGLGGDTLQISIGQLNAFTPLQLANYAATFANGGTHYKATLIDSITSYDLSTVYEKQKKEVVNTVEISNSTVSSIKEGMLAVTVDGTGRAALGDYPIKLGGKTGTSQTNSGADHSTLIIFAPYENPEIAISVVLEHGSSGFSAGTVAREILDAYFVANGNSSADKIPYVILE